MRPPRPRSNGGTTLRAGVIGAGRVAQEAHIPALRALGVEIAAVCDANADRAHEVAHRFEVPAAFTDYAELLSQAELDLVTVALPNAFHVPVSIAALRSGRHVLCEKPMSVSADGAREMIEAARTSGSLLAVNQHMRFDRTAVALQAAVAAGELGRVYLADARLVRREGIPGYGSWFTNGALAGHGALFDIGVHMLDLVLFVLGFPQVVAVKGYLGDALGRQGIGLGDWGIDRGSTGTFDVDDTAMATLTLADGGQIRMLVAWASLGLEEERVTLLGTRGGADRSSLLYGEAEPLRLFRAGEDGSIVDVTPELPDGPEIPWFGAVDAFVRAVRGQPSTIVAPEQALVTTTILERIAQSAAAGRELEL